ncbi:MAG: GNAT family N-acetyltransferase [Acidimicrobiia bacterium]|nr:GNAT family N-acetyltransferase [Acidimicrobiia bacterium]
MNFGFTIRDFEESDYPLLAAYDAAAYDDDLRPPELWKHDDATRDPGLFFRRHVVEVTGGPVACGCFGHSDWIDDPDRYWFQILVPRDREGIAVRDAYLQFALDSLARRHPSAVLSGMVESYEAHVRFLLDQGFVEIHREHISRLQVTDFVPQDFGTAVARVEAQGIALSTLADLDEGDWPERLHPVYQRLVADQPAPDPPRLDTLAEWLEGVIGSPDFESSLWVVARDGEDIVGLSQAAANSATPTLAYFGLTGVDRNYRRRGIATALKVELLSILKDRGIVRIDTANEENNPMYRINLGLGFVPRPDWVMYERKL